jgi:hypothetical protein
MMAITQAIMAVRLHSSFPVRLAAFFPDVCRTSVKNKHGVAFDSFFIINGNFHRELAIA